MNKCPFYSGEEAYSHALLHVIIVAVPLLPKTGELDVWLPFFETQRLNHPKPYYIQLKMQRAKRKNKRSWLRVSTARQIHITAKTQIDLQIIMRGALRTVGFGITIPYHVTFPIYNPNPLQTAPKNGAPFQQFNNLFNNLERSCC